MADFCAQCSVDVFGEDMGDMAGMISEKKVKAGFVLNVLCEDCGPCQVDHEGRCVSEDCLKKHGTRSTGSLE